MSWLAAAGVGGAGAGTSILSALATYQQGQFTKNLADRQNQALVNQAQQVQQQAGADIAQQDYQAIHTISSMVAATGASGITAEGSPATIQATSVEEAKLNDMYLKHAANIQATNLYYQGQVGMAQGEQQAQAATLGAITGGTTGAITSGIEAYGIGTKTGSFGSSYSSDPIDMQFQPINIGNS